MRLHARQSGFTFIEFVMAIAVMAVIGLMTASLFQGKSDFERWEETRKKMEAIRVSLLGDTLGDPGFERSRFGYFGDMGRLPTNFTLITAAETPAWAFVGSNGVGAGWRGPYYNPKFRDSYAMELDGWGRAFIYSTTSLTSFGSDALASGAGHATDLMVAFPVSERLASVVGRLTDRGEPLQTIPVVLRYSSNGSLIGSTSLTAADGTFSFTTVPFGVRSLLITSLIPPIGPLAMAVDRPTVVVPENQIEFFGRSAVTLNSIAISAAPMQILSALADSSNSNDSQISMAYTVPPNSGANPLLLVAVGADDKSSDVLPNSADVDGDQMYLVTSGLSSTSGNRTGYSLYSLMTTAGYYGTITARFQGTLKPRIISACTLTRSKNAIPEAMSVAVNASGGVLTSITPLTAGSMIVTAVQQGAKKTLDPSGLNHVEDVEEIKNGNSAAMGHILTTSLQLLSTVGWTSSGSNRMVVMAASFPPAPDPVTGTLASSYQTLRTLEYLVVRWSGVELLNAVTVNGVTQSTPGVPSGTRINIINPMTIPARATTAGFSLTFTNTMTARDMVATFEWTTGDKDTIKFTVP